MSRMRLTLEHAEAAVVGGAVLGGGGGGHVPDGLDRGRLAVTFGAPELISVDELPGDAMIVTAALVGAPSPAGRCVRPVDFVRAAQILVERTGIRLGGFVTNENGAGGTVNGWLQAAALGVPVIDAPCNGRAHPTGLMGAMGLHKVTGFVSHQVAVGGSPEASRYLEVHAMGTLLHTAAVTRHASVEAGGLVAVARDPVTASYVKEHAAMGAIRQALAAGQAMIAVRDRGGAAVAHAAAEHLGGRLVDTGTVAAVRLETSGGYDIGRLQVHGRHGRYEITFWNEYMTLDADGERLATFPDLVATLNPQSGMPLASAEITQGVEVTVLTVSSSRLILGAGMRDPVLFRDIERAVGKEVARHVF